MINDNVVEITITDAMLSACIFFEYILASKKFKIADIKKYDNKYFELNWIKVIES